MNHIICKGLTRVGKVQWLLLFLFVGFLACAPVKEALTAAELKKYVARPENGLTKEMIHDNHLITVTMRPNDLIVAQELKTANNPDEETINKLKKNYAPFIYFNVSLSENNQDITNAYAGKKQVFERMIKCLSFEMGTYVKLITSAGDTVKVADYSYPRTYGSTGNTQLQFVFDNEKIMNSNYVDFCMSDISDLNIAACRLRFNTSDIKALPHLNFKNNNNEI